MAEVNKTQQTGSGMTDTNELQSTRTHGQEAAKDLKSEAGGVVEEYRGTAEQVWDDTKERVFLCPKPVDVIAGYRGQCVLSPL